MKDYFNLQNMKKSLFLKLDKLQRWGFVGCIDHFFKINGYLPDEMILSQKDYDSFKHLRLNPERQLEYPYHNLLIPINVR
jgi:hypothetical protein